MPRLELLETRCLLSTTINEFPLPNANSGPNNMVSGPDGNVWFNEINRDTLGKISPTGQVTEVPLPVPDVNAPFLFGPDGNIWLGLQTSIAEITPQGALLHDYDIPSASRPGIPDTGLTITMGPDGNIWYAEPYTQDLIGRLTPAGQITEFAVPGGVDFGSDGVAGLIPGPDGNIWFEATAFNAIGRVNLDGNSPNGVNTNDPIDIFNLPPAPQNDAPRGLIVGPDKNLWMTVAAQTPGGIDQILRVNTAGQLTGQFNVPTPDAGAYAMTVGSDGAMWFTEHNANQIGRITTDGNITEIPVPTGQIWSSITKGPDGNIWFNELDSNSIGELVTQTATTTTVAASANPSVFNQPVTFTATVTPAAGTGTPSGSVDFFDTTTNTDLGSVALSGGVATLNISSLAVGSHTITATYSGDGTFLGSNSTLTQVVNKATPIFSLVAPPTIIDGTSNTQITGAIAAGSLIPPSTETVTVTVNGASYVAPINPDGTFAVTVPTASLGTGSYTIGYSYAGDNNFTSASATANMDVTNGVLALFNQSKAKNAGSTIPIQIELVSASGQDVSSAGTTVTALGIAATTDTTDKVGSIDPSLVGALQPVQAAGNSNPNNVFREQGGSKPFYMYNLQTPTGLTAGTYRLYFQVQGDPLWHWVTFTVS